MLLILFYTALSSCVVIEDLCEILMLVEGGSISLYTARDQQGLACWVISPASQHQCAQGRQPLSGNASRRAVQVVSYLQSGGHLCLLPGFPVALLTCCQVHKVCTWLAVLSLTMIALDSTIVFMMPLYFLIYVNSFYKFFFAYCLQDFQFCLRIFRVLLAIVIVRDHLCCQSLVQLCPLIVTLLSFGNSIWLLWSPQDKPHILVIRLLEGVLFYRLSSSGYFATARQCFDVTFNFLV